MKITLKSRNGKFTKEVTAATVEDLKDVVKKEKRISPERQRLTLERDSKIVLGSGDLTANKVKDGDVVMFKDLGPQVGYQTVFIVEYAGPLFIYLFFYMRPAGIYDPELVAQNPLGDVQNYACYLWCFHYIKREVETLLVHRFSHGTMPLFNLFKNSGYYWTFAAWVAYIVNHPLYTPPSNQMQILVCLVLFVVFAISNGITHIMLRNLRPAGSKKRVIPRGFLFELVSCPNYTFEIWMWLAFTVMTHALPALMFTLAGGAQMIIWAMQKHRRYRKDFDGKEGREQYPRGRKVIFPFLF
eukprot:GFYU01001146.1.p1 GENE.GFYU01001146.1~~GFYU01001146.1.p1  ORF type:complete len:299 (+),score=112.22 GFYU01001146.1:36-932(+)